MEQLEALKPRMAKLAALDAKYKITATYHTYSGVNSVAGLCEVFGINHDEGKSFTRHIMNNIVISTREAATAVSLECPELATSLPTHDSRAVFRDAHCRRA